MLSNYNYYYYSDSVNFTTAKSRCRSSGYELAMPKSEAQYRALLVDLFNKTDSSSFSVWLGLTDSVTEGTYLWGDNDPLSWSSWRNTEPDSTTNDDDCVRVKIYNRVSQGWWDENCSNNYHFICQKNKTR